MRQLFTVYDRPASDAEVHDCTDTITEIEGYVPAEKVIRAMIAAGSRLPQSRHEQFDLPPEAEDVPDGMDFPEREPGFDIAEASDIANKLERKFERSASEAKKEARAKKHDEARQNVAGQEKRDGEPAPK